MLRAHPDSVTLLQAVMEFIRDRAMPALEASMHMEARMACNLLEIVQREIVQAPAAIAAEEAGLRRLLRKSGQGDALNEFLCQGICDGSIDVSDRELQEFLWQSTLAKLAVDQPSYRYGGTSKNSSALG